MEKLEEMSLKELADLANHLLYEFNENDNESAGDEYDAVIRYVEDTYL